MSEQPAASDDTGRDLPCQLDVYFDRFLSIDTDQLEQFVNSREPGEVCEVTALEESENEEGLRIGGFSAAQGGLIIGALNHSVPSPAADLIRSSSLAKPVLERLVAHRAWTLLTLVGGDDRPPVERLLFMYKVAAGLCLQGALGVGNLHTRRVFPGGLLCDLFGKPPAAEETSIWDLLRTGEPIAMLASITQVELLGRRFLATCGYGYCGLPDLLWEYTTPQEADAAATMFQNVFTYMMERGPVIGAGHTVGYDKNIAFRFSEPDEGLELPYPTMAVLLMTKEANRR